MAERTEPYGLLAAFDSGAALTAAIRRVREAGYRHVDAYSPVPAEQACAALGARDGRVTVVAFLCGLAGAAGGYFMQWYSAVHAFPFVIGGKPLHAWPAFMVVAFVLAVLSAAVGAAVAMLVLNGLPRPYHPAFNARVFERAGSDRFLLCIRAEDPCFDAERTRALLDGLGPETVEEVAP